jgi:predicted metal-dependent phosphotriesterase family hydrolase
VGHLNNTLDPEYHHELARLGVWLGWDINNPGGRPNLPPWQERTDYLKARLDEGLAPNMMLSHDWNVVLSRLGTSGFPKRDENPDGFLWLSNKFIPKLQELGVKQGVVDQMMVDNPRRHFEGVRAGE